MVVNPSGLVPVGHAILLEPYEPDFDAARKSGLIIPDQLRNNSIMVEMRSRVIALGDEAYRPENATWLRRLMTPWRPRCLPGDKIMVQKMTGAIVVGPLDGKQYRLVNEEDVFV
jgi:co-chaperonin GroES (HSP10)